MPACADPEIFVRGVQVNLTKQSSDNGFFPNPPVPPSRSALGQRNGRSLFLPLWKEAGLHGEKNHCELARNRQTGTSRFEAGGVRCIISSTKFTQEPQRKRHRTSLFSARTPNVARARKTPHPLKRKKKSENSEKNIQIKR